MPQATDPSETLSRLSDQLADAVERAGRAVVQVNGRHRRPSSGVVYAPTLVLVAEHAVERENDLTVETATGSPLAAQLVGRDLPVTSPYSVYPTSPANRPWQRPPHVSGSSSSPWAARTAVSSWPVSVS